MKCYAKSSENLIVQLANLPPKPPFLSKSFHLFSCTGKTHYLCISSAKNKEQNKTFLPFNFQNIGRQLVQYAASKRKRDAAIIANNNLTEKIVTEKPIEKIKDKPFLTITETAIYLGVTRPTIYGYLKRGDLKATRIGTKFLLSKDDINNMFNHPADFKLPPKEKQAITEFYTTAEIIEKFNVSESWIFVMAKKNKIPKTFNRGKTYWSKKHVDAYFSSKAPDADITEWYSVQEVQDKFQMSLNAIYSFVYKNAIPKKKVGITVYYSKKHFDIAKGIRQAEEPKYYTVREAMEKFKITRDQLYHYTKYHQIPKIKKGKYTFISKPELDNLFEDPIIG